MMELHSPLLRYRREIRLFVPFVIPIVKAVESWYNIKHEGRCLSTEVHRGFRCHKLYEEVRKKWRSKK
jgi:hypothetical protein